MTTYGVIEAATYLHVSPGTIRHWIDLGVLPADAVGSTFRIDRADLDRLRHRSNQHGPEDHHTATVDAAAAWERNNSLPLPHPLDNEPEPEDYLREDR